MCCTNRVVALEGQRIQSEIFSDPPPQINAVNEVVANAQEPGELALGHLSNRVLALWSDLGDSPLSGRRDAPTEQDMIEMVDDIWIPALPAAVS